ncbi:hypothetical protein KAK07_01490 [Ideonella sp. 4Y16]|uniref:hypothetical protein n=1 Tax=Ideonella alba TaxID=2824118 RepID=UPI001B370333|nr:hypothetical protein [Ideonella alba]MBQ0941999.1 hypothetical protein [Ideonella alba]
MCIGDRHGADAFGNALGISIVDEMQATGRVDALDESSRKDAAIRWDTKAPNEADVWAAINQENVRNLDQATVISDSPSDEEWFAYQDKAQRAKGLSGLALEVGTKEEPLRRGADGKLYGSDGRVIERTPDGVRIKNPDGTYDEPWVRPQGGPDAMPIPPSPKGNPLAPFFGEAGAEALSSVAALGKVADLQCLADGKLKTPGFGDLELKADLVQGGGVKIKGDSAVFKTDDAWMLSRKPLGDDAYQLIATSVTTQKSLDLMTLGNASSAVLTTVFSGDGLLTYANPVEIKEAFPDTKTKTLGDVLDGMENKDAAKVLEKAAKKYGPPFVDVIDGRLEIGKSLNVAGQGASIGCSVDAAQGLPRLTSMLAGIPGLAIQDLFNGTITKMRNGWSR